MTIEYEPIGVIHSPFTELDGMPVQPTGAVGTRGTVELFPEYQEGLHDLREFSHIILLYHFHRSHGFDRQVVPFLDRQPRGLFATRAPRRPNPIGLSVLKLLDIRDNFLQIENIDIVTGTPLLDIKPYVPAFDGPTVARIGWYEDGRVVSETRSDTRFLR